LVFFVKVIEILFHDKARKPHLDNLFNEKILYS
jgi:hypothetical protein